MRSISLWLCTCSNVSWSSSKVYKLKLWYGRCADVNPHLEPSFLAEAQYVFTNHSILLDRLQSMLNGSLAIEGSTDAESLSSASFAAMTKISQCSEAFWHNFKNAAICPGLLRRLVLENPRWMIRRRSVDYLKTICLDPEL